LLSRNTVCFVSWLMVALAFPALADAAESSQITGVSAAQLFAAAEKAEASGASADAESIYRALAKDPNPDIRHEARFRHAQLLERQQRYKDAALLMREILDEKPDAQTVRLELARLLNILGDTAGARRALRQAQAGGLPPDVAQVVDQYAAALRSTHKPLGLSLELALAPSTNVNRATRAKTLDTIIAPFDLSEDARAKSGIGLRSGGQAYARMTVGSGIEATARLSGQSSLYRDGQFNDAVAAGQIGLEARRGKTLLRPQIGRSYRWYGQRLYATTNTFSLSAIRPLGRRSQVEIQGGVGWANYRTNDLQDGNIYDASITIEHAFNARAGGSLSLSGQRQTAVDPGFATASGGIALLVWQDWGKATLFATANTAHLEADTRLFLFPKRRNEWLMRISAGASLRHIKLVGFSPVVRVNYERNWSTIGIYDYRSLNGEIGLARAF
jgi:outer membrane protein